MVRAFQLFALSSQASADFCCYWPVYPADCGSCQEKHPEIAEEKCSSADQNTWCATGSCSSKAEHDCLGNDVDAVAADSADDCCSKCDLASGCGAAVFVEGVDYTSTCYMKTHCEPTSGCSGDTCTAVIPGGAPSPTPSPSPSGRRVSWWWYGDDESESRRSRRARGNATNAAVQFPVSNVVNFVTENKNIVSSVIMNCGVHLSNKGHFVGDLSTKCQQLIPHLLSLGVEPHLWLGESDNLDAQHLLFQNWEKAADFLVSLGQKYGLKGMNIDLEADGQGQSTPSTPADAVLFVKFLNKVKPRLNAAGMVFTVDVDATNWCPIIGNVGLLADAADKVMDMGTYTAGSYHEWSKYYGQLNPTSHDLTKIGVGLGIGPDFNSDTWDTTKKSAEQRICQLMNDGVLEIDMFDLEPGQGYPRNFWIPQLEKFMAGGGCQSETPTEGEDAYHTQSQFIV